jgi:imidazolonepropionase-like amidohydrolase
MPGLIDARTSAGLFGDGTGFQNADNEESSDPDTAWVRAIDALNPGDPAFEDAIRAGVTTVLAGPGTSNAALQRGRWPECCGQDIWPHCGFDIGLRAGWSAIELGPSALGCSS